MQTSDLDWLDTDLEKIDRLCGHSATTMRVSGGDYMTGPGISVYACNSCSALKFKKISELFPNDTRAIPLDTDFPTSGTDEDVVPLITVHMEGDFEFTPEEFFVEGVPDDWNMDTLVYILKESPVHRLIVEWNLEPEVSVSIQAPPDPLQRALVYKQW